MTVTYEITAVVSPELADRYERYMIEQHIPDVLATGYFETASFGRSGDRYRVRYEARSRPALDEYLRSHSERLRADFAAHFPTGIALTRENWDVIAVFPPQ